MTEYVLEAILFDMSGTLIDDFTVTFRALQDVFKLYGLSLPSRREFRREFKLPYTSYLIEKGFRPSQLREAVIAWKKQYSQYKDCIRLFSDVKPTLTMLRDIKLGIVSQTPKELLEDSLRTFGIRSFFDVVVCDEKKPDPEGLLLAMNEFHINHPAVVIYVGDMRDDMEAAWSANILSGMHKQLKVFPVGIYRDRGGFHDLETLKQGNPSQIVRSLAELIPLVQPTPAITETPDNQIVKN